MMKVNLTIGSIFLAIQFASVGVSTITSPAADSKTAVAAAAPAPVSTAAETHEFKALAQATLAALAAGNKTEMVAKLTDLETAWDDQEKSLRPKSETVWVALDKTMDQAISSLRSNHVNLPKGKTALEDLIKKLDQSTQP